MCGGGGHCERECGVYVEEERGPLLPDSAVPCQMLMVQNYSVPWGGGGGTTADFS